MTVPEVVVLSFPNDEAVYVGVFFHIPTLEQAAKGKHYAWQLHSGAGDCIGRGQVANRSRARASCKRAARQFSARFPQPAPIRYG